MRVPPFVALVLSCLGIALVTIGIYRIGVDAALVAAGIGLVYLFAIKAEVGKPPTKRRRRR